MDDRGLRSHHLYKILTRKRVVIIEVLVATIFLSIS